MEQRTAEHRGTRDPRRDAGTIALGLTAAALQTLLLFRTALRGLSWGGWSYLAAVGLVALGLGIVAVLAVQRRRSAVAVPLVCAAAVQALLLYARAGGAVQ